MFSKKINSLTLREIADLLETNPTTIQNEEYKAVNKILQGLMQMVELNDFYDGDAKRLLLSIHSETSIPLSVLGKVYMDIIHKNPVYKRYWSI